MDNSKRLPQLVFFNLQRALKIARVKEEWAPPQQIRREGGREGEKREREGGRGRGRERKGGRERRESGVHGNVH